MTSYEHIAIIRALAEGRDPFSGHPLAPTGLLNDARIARALIFAADSLQSMSGQKSETLDRPANAGVAWDSRQESELLAAFDSGMSVGNLARKMGRTRGAIQARLSRLGRLQP